MSCAASRCMHRGARTKAAARYYLCIFFVLLLAFGCVAEDQNDNDGSEDNEAHDYEDDDGGDWWGDDPYLEMIDDAVRHQLNAQIERDRNAARYEREHTTHEIVKYVTSISLSIVGMASAIFCTAVSLYFIRVDALMRQYSEDGAEVDGRIVASVPDIHEAMKKRNRIINPDSYSMMSDDGSYRLDSDSISEGSGQGTGKKDIEGAQSNEVAGADEVEIVNEEGRQPHVIVAMNSAKMDTSKPRQRAYKENALISEDAEAFHSSKSFRVLVEYNGNPYHQDGIDRTASETIRKRLLVRGEDIVETPGNGLLVKLHVLPDRPKSGYPSPEIERALRVEKRLSSNLHLMFGVALVLVGVGAAGALLPPKLFYAYVGVLICQVPLMICFLDRAFSTIISDRYLDNGSSGQHLDVSKSGPEEKDKMVAALRNGTSFGSFA